MGLRALLHPLLGGSRSGFIDFLPLVFSDPPRTFSPLTRPHHDEAVAFAIDANVGMNDLSGFGPGTEPEKKITASDANQVPARQPPPPTEPGSEIIAISAPYVPIKLSKRF